MKAFAVDKIYVTQNLKFDLEKVQKIGGNRRKCWLPALSPHPTMFSKAFFCRAVKTRNHLEKGLI